MEFTSKGGHTGKKGVQAKKISNFDLDSLSLEESDDKTAKKGDAMTGMGTSFGASMNDGTTTTSESKTTSYSGYGSYSSNSNSTEDAAEKIKKFGNAKAISSDQFNGTKK